jgi:hypothetical protein
MVVHKIFKYPKYYFLLQVFNFLINIFIYLLYSMSNWLDLSNNANTVKSTYIQGFLDVSGNAEINQNISTNHYKSIRSITVDIGTNSSSSKTVSFSYGKTYSDISNLAFNVNVYSVGSSDNKPIDVTIYNYTTSGANLLVEASSTESDKTWSYSLKANVVIFETQ